MLDAVQIRRRGVLDFEACYDSACALQDTVPVPAVKANLGQGVLDFCGDRLKLVDWPPILQSLAINKHLHHVAIKSCYQPTSADADRYRSSFRKWIPAFRSKDMTFRLCKALRDCLTTSPSLRSLQLQGLPLRPRDLIQLTKGLAKSASLENLSLAYCPIGDEGLEAICQSVKYSTSIKTVDFTGCNLTWRGAEHMASIIKHQAMRRHSAAWAESLRYRKPELDSMSGLRRVTLSCNTLIGDRGAAVLAQELAEDFWVKALDLQKCGLSDVGAKALLGALKSNTTLAVLDIRRNPLVDNGLIKAVIEKVLLNTEGTASQYSWIKPPSSKDAQNPTGQRQIRMPGSGVRGRANVKKGSLRTSVSGGRRSSPSLSSHVGSGKHVPWRAAARANRQRGDPQDFPATGNHSCQNTSTVKVTVETESEEAESEEPESLIEAPALGPQQKITVLRHKRLQVELEESRLRLAEERKARVRADALLFELELENKRLRSINLSLSEAIHSQSTAAGALDDEAVLAGIEASFQKFHAFLDLLKDAGLGQLASMAGIDQADFRLLARPNLTSTVGTAGAQKAQDCLGLVSSTGELSAASGHQPRSPVVGDLLQPVAPEESSDLRNTWRTFIMEERGNQSVPSPLWPIVRLESHDLHDSGSYGNGSCGNNCSGNRSHKETSSQSNSGKRSESLGSRSYGGKPYVAHQANPNGRPATGSELLENIHSLGSL
ncbi:centrosomal protein of 78 kDa isoform X2 [Brienomyrus brachyistius]|uniref:centrosomal protein of 78 kDa isoform X2 n=1 Tax=Brienomyrus brachyistius TaxID=42636 RepID=UPI0020B3D775|nr:centrosomal protein of 78 kDa isoform X2 [Brienomyrus brachyistius]